MMQAQISDMQIFCLQKADMERHERLRLARKRHFAIMKEAAESLGIPYPTYQAHEAGSRGFKDDELALYARRFHVSRAWLAFGEGNMDDNVTEKESADGSISRSFDSSLRLKESTPSPHDKVYIQVEMEELRRILRGVLENEGIPEEQADAYADAVFLSLRERASASIVLRLMDASRTVPEFPARSADDQS